ncbi:hypothetical protein HMPREF0860_0427 [Treponema socranskii subsp. socranskii VPI DR56BR1116 = ATCC 35536]|uniref:Uncharacterized protein n=1 Tax=Treponema socranskii subsp. socranskii VPI DR56BR1116 = ATCC 35536 TaxID=1125725 RepID=U2MEH8_TRESO|nr:hypothetical protein HMPREF1325_2641 [Treponema socranskii subsp. socranskii VPI DR56BR1116 = ATCC 35536]ERJ97718.1 hypothetical protein HMPREF0860_0427 [Treponema socranskii subsp. socranskii VPI DR56BR1116 = ATCC 35536]
MQRPDYMKKNKGSGKSIVAAPPPVNRRFFHIKYNHDSEYNSLP